jgi:hypothetical protein
VIVAISPSRLGTGGVTWATPSVPSTAFTIACSWRGVSASPFGVSTAMRNGPFEPGPNAALSWS